MYKRLILASDCTRESLVALREGALIARSFEASSHLLIIDPHTAAARTAESVSLYPCTGRGDDLMALGLDRLRRLGVPASGEVVRGDPARIIVECVRRLAADLVVLGHRRQSFLDRWWSGPAGLYIADGVSCSVLVARDTITDAEFEAMLDR